MEIIEIGRLLSVVAIGFGVFRSISLERYIKDLIKRPKEKSQATGKFFLKFGLAFLLMGIGLAIQPPTEDGVTNKPILYGSIPGLVGLFFIFGGILLANRKLLLYQINHPQKARKLLRIFWATFVAIDFLIVSFAIFSGPTEIKKDLSNWSNYKNSEYGFEFKYPSNWKIDTSTSSPLIAEINEHPDWGGASGGVFVAINEKYSTKEEALVGVEKSFKLYPKTTFSAPEFLEISGSPAIKYSYVNYEIVPNGVTYVFYQEGLRFTITDLYEGEEKVPAAIGEIQQRILSSLKFL